METFWLQGVVKSGQVVLDVPLDVPDGTVVTVMTYDPDDDPRPQEPKLTLTAEEFAEFTAFFTRKKDPDGFAEFKQRVENAQAGRETPGSRP